MKITAAIITHNEEKNIKECIESIQSVGCIDEILIIDSNSTDKTLDIARSCNVHIISTDITNVTEKRKLSLEKIANNWILFIDADERISDELKQELISLQSNSKESISGYYINRKNFYLGKWIKHCGIYPDYHIRLFDKTKSSITDRIVHEGIIVNGETEKLRGHIIHYSVSDFGQMVSKINYYSTLEAQEHFQNKKSISKFGVITHAVSAFLRVFISRRGYKDGIHGFFVSIMDSMVNFMTHLKLLKLQGKL